MAYSSSPNIPQALQLTPLGAMQVGMSLTPINITPVSVAANTSVGQNFTVPGVLKNDYVDVTPPSFLAGIGGADCYISANNVLTIIFTNSTAGALVPPAGTYMLLSVR